MKLPEPFDRDGFRVEFQHYCGPDSHDPLTTVQLISYKVTSPDGKKYGRGIRFDGLSDPGDESSIFNILNESIDKTIDMIKKRS